MNSDNFDTMYESLLDNAIKSMENAEASTSREGGRYFIAESKAWLKLAKFARKMEDRNASD